ncbi:sialidase family protein [Herbaspirillum sp. ST 5-3]|uniref:WD40/YVTN/BNR-like repeat-containing protein n=1 Tax=Oxalobacteraceae TaxID=75682 RepID=UPI0010A458BB|nr:sialidase family protein [Herbaspirillum sp. ST 5-3]
MQKLSSKLSLYPAIGDFKDFGDHWESLIIENGQHWLKLGAAILDDGTYAQARALPRLNPIVSAYALPNVGTAVRGITLANGNIVTGVSATGGKTINVSTDGGATWANKTVTGSTTHNEVTELATAGTTVVATCDYNATATNRFMHSTDSGVTWNSTGPSETASWDGLACKPDGSLWVAAKSLAGTLGFSRTSPDGVAWTDRTPAGLTSVTSISRIRWSALMDTFIGSGGGSSSKFFTTSDGINFTDITPAGVSAAVFYDLFEVGSVMYMPGARTLTGGTSQPGYWKSTDNGATWTFTTYATIAALANYASAWEMRYLGGMFYFMSTGNNVFPVFVTSADLITFSSPKPAYTGISTAYRSFVIQSSFKCGNRLAIGMTNGGQIYDLPLASQYVGAPSYTQSPTSNSTLLQQQFGKFVRIK